MNFKCYESQYHYVEDDYRFQGYIETEKKLSVASITFSVLCLFVNILFYLSMGHRKTSLFLFVCFLISYVIEIILFFADRNFLVVNKCNYFCTSVQTCEGGICAKTKDGNVCNNELIIKRQIPIICSFIFSLILNIFALKDSGEPNLELPSKELLEARLIKKEEPLIIEVEKPFSIQLDPIHVKEDREDNPFMHL
jgi:hypothetical protein